MKYILTKYITVFLLLFNIISCSKKNDVPKGTASLTIINAVPGSNKLVTNFSDSYSLNGRYIFANAITYNVFYGLNQVFSSYSGTQKLVLYQFPDTLPKSIPLFDLTLNLPIASINTLFLTGTVNAPDTLFTTDQPPYHSTSDSVTGIRFVNLSPGSAPISVNIQGQADGSEINALPYKKITAFKNYAANSVISSYTFEFKDAATGALLGTYTATGINNDGTDPGTSTNEWRFRNSTLVFLGLPNETGELGQSVLLINNY